MILPMINLHPEKQRGKDEVVRVNSTPLKPFWNHTEQAVAGALDDFLRTRPYLNLGADEIRKILALALNDCPARYIHSDTLSFDDVPACPKAVIESAVLRAVRKITDLRPPKIK